MENSAKDVTNETKTEAITKKDRINLVELGIFTSITVIFLNSLYHLFFTSIPTEGFLKKTSTIAAIESTNKAIAESTSEQLIEIPCSTSPLITSTQASKVRLTGPICMGSGRSIASAKDVAFKASKIVNITNDFSATVFHDPETNKFTTDYVPVTMGKNLINLDFSYDTGAKYSKEIEVVKQ